MFGNLKEKISQINWQKVFGYCRWFNIQLTTAFGITTTIHWSVPLFLVIMCLYNPMNAGMFCIALLSIVPHEYGHALAARLYKIKTARIVIYPIGGVAFLENGLVKLDRWKELIVAGAGPAVSLALALIGLGMFFLTGTFVEGQRVVGNFTNLWFLFGAINMSLFVFNLLPAFPMDGGRILRGILSFFMDYVQATRLCVHISTALGIGLSILGIMYGNITIAITMLLIAMMGRGELHAAEMRQRAENGEKFKVEMAKKKLKDDTI